MIVTPVLNQFHIRCLHILLEKRDLTCSIDDMPEFGLIAIKGDTPIAAGFIRRVEGPYAILDSFITNPDTPSEFRDRALDLITEKLITIADYNNVTKLISFTTEKNIFIRSIKHGFASVPHYFSIKNSMK